jgi:hypothetical protein
MLVNDNTSAIDDSIEPPGRLQAAGIGSHQCDIAEADTRDPFGIMV